MAERCLSAQPGVSRRRRVLIGATASGSLLLCPTLAAAARATRVVSVGGAITETVAQLGAERLLVGVDTTSEFPASLATLPRVGYQRALSAEGILSLRPTLLLASADAGPPAALAHLKAAGVPIARAEGDHSYEALLRNVSTVGGALDLPQASVALQARLELEWREVNQELRARDRSRSGTAPRVLFVLSHAANAVQASGAGTAADAMIRYAGGQNVFGSGPGRFDGYRPLSAEAVIAAAPQVLLCTRQGIAALGGTEGLLARPGLALTPAGRAGRVVAMDALLLLGFGPRLPQAVRELALAFDRIP
jgi:iron complex transport system substrate-binding protein